MTLTELRTLTNGTIDAQIDRAKEAIEQYKNGLLTADELAITLEMSGLEINVAVRRLGGMAVWAKD